MRLVGESNVKAGGASGTTESGKAAGLFVKPLSSQTRMPHVPPMPSAISNVHSRSPSKPGSAGRSAPSGRRSAPCSGRIGVARSVTRVPATAAISRESGGRVRGDAPV